MKTKEVRIKKQKRQYKDTKAKSEVESTELKKQKGVKI
jgi:hypothetical protein